MEQIWDVLNQNVLNYDLKSPVFVPFGANLTHFVSKSAISVSNNLFLQAFLNNIYLWLNSKCSVIIEFFNAIVLNQFFKLYLNLEDVYVDNDISFDTSNIIYWFKNKSYTFYKHVSIRSVCIQYITVNNFSIHYSLYYKLISIFK